MTERLEKLCALLEKCRCFADVGCDHGYCAAYMLDGGLCQRAVVTDISAGSLSKAQKLLDGYIRSGVCRAVCCDGLEGVPEDEADLALIAGMGGEEIIKILKNAYIPRSFVFQPMKNSGKLRAFLIDSGCSLEYDGVFTERRGGEEKYYFAIKGRREGGTREYSAAELAFGRDSLKSAELKRLLREEIAKNTEYARGDLSPRSRQLVQDRLEFLKGVAGLETE